MQPPLPTGRRDPRRRTPLLAVAVAAALIAGCGTDEPPRPIAGGVEADPETSVFVAPAREGPGPPAATRNTSRVAGDSAEIAAQVALATHPRFAEAPPVETAVLVDGDDPLTAIAASVFAAGPLRAALLIGESGSVPAATSAALTALAPTGPEDAPPVIAIGDVRAPEGLEATRVEGDDPAGLANEIDKQRERLFRAEPRRIVLASLADPAFAMPAAAWAARSGDSVLFVEPDSIPEPTREALRRHRTSPVYALGPDTVISDEVLERVGNIAPRVRRVAGADPVTNSLAVARYADGSFGWDINDPGHGLVLAYTAIPIDAYAAAALSASGKWGALLLTGNPDSLPVPVREFMLDIKPGYRDDPTRAVYNHVWVIGDESAISFAVQAEADELAELAPIGPGVDIVPGAGPAPPEAEADTGGGQ